MLISYNEACAKDCSTLEQDLELTEQYMTALREGVRELKNV